MSRMSPSSYRARRMEAGLRADFLRLHSKANGLEWCRCVAWWVETWEGWGERSTEQNLALREELFERGEFDGYLLYDDADPIAWCQVGPRDRLRKLTLQFERRPDARAWAITCFVVAPEHRRRGAARALLQAVLGDLEARRATQGIASLEAYPRVLDPAAERADQGSAGGGREADPLALWNGPEPLFTQAGFVPLGRVGERWVLEHRLGSDAASRLSE